MATYSTGITVTWGAATFKEVTGLSWTYGGSDAKGREAPGEAPIWTDSPGTLSLQCLHGDNISISEYGKRKQLTVAGGGQSLTTYAVYESVDVTSELNGVTRYAVSFKILDG